MQLGHTDYRIIAEALYQLTLIDKANLLDDVLKNLDNDELKSKLHILQQDFAVQEYQLSGKSG